jgi:CRP/FNR family transcriptional regulator, cyclic AMP receptor protein
MAIIRDTNSLLKILNRQLYKRDQIIFREGDEPTNAFIIRSGSVAIVKNTPDGPQRLTKLVSNQVFGELALMENTPRSASAIALEATEVLVITPDQFKAKIGKLDFFMKFWVGYLTERIYDLSERVRD